MALRCWVLAALLCAVRGAEDVVCQEEEGNLWARLEPLGPSVFSISNVTRPNATLDTVTVLDLVLYADYAEVALPNGLTVRVITAEYEKVELDLSLNGLMDLQQNIWEIMLGNLIGTLLCCFVMGLLAYLEKKFKCIGGKQLHEISEMQNQLHDDLERATAFLNAVQGDPSQLNGKARAIALGYQAVVAADKVKTGLDEGMDAAAAVRSPTA